MTIKELIDYLGQFPDTAEVVFDYEDERVVDLEHRDIPYVILNDDTFFEG